MNFTRFQLARFKGSTSFGLLAQSDSHSLGSGAAKLVFLKPEQHDLYLNAGTHESPAEAILKLIRNETAINDNMLLIFQFPFVFSFSNAFDRSRFCWPEHRPNKTIHVPVTQVCSHVFQGRSHPKTTIDIQVRVHTRVIKEMGR